MGAGHANAYRCRYRASGAHALQNKPVNGEVVGGMINCLLCYVGASVGRWKGGPVEGWIAMFDLRALFGTSILLAGITLSLGHDAAAQDQEVLIALPSSHAGMVSGGDALVEIATSPLISVDEIRVQLNGQDVTQSFRASGEGKRQALLRALHVGANELIATRWGTGTVLGQAIVTNYPISGPVFSGPHQTPFICQSEEFELAIIGGMLGPALNTDCSAETRAYYVYKSTDGSFKALNNPSARPDDLAETTTLDGETVAYVVRVETGTINRAIYQIAILHDPMRQAPPDPWTRPKGWNGRLLYTFGGGCNAGYRQGTQNNGGLIDNTDIGDAGLANGFAVATSSLNAFRHKCDDVLSAETLMMVKEHFIETFGVPDHTIGLGASGGSMQVYLIARNYPGLLDGIIPIISFPDTLTFAMPYFDCGLLIRYFDEGTQLSWSEKQKAAVAGHRTFEYCSANARYVKLIQPNTAESCDAAIPMEQRFDTEANPDGVRCTLFDDMVNVYGRDSGTGFAQRPVDNVGIQYGLKAFNDGAINAEQFLELNEAVGGYDINGNHSLGRMRADIDAVTRAYRTGRVNSGKGLVIPIIDFRAYADAVGDLHDARRSQITRARLIAANGSADNQIVVTLHPETEREPLLSEYFLQMDHWLGAIANDDSTAANMLERVARNRPVGLSDACYDGAVNRITDPAECERLYPISLQPRLAAGEPLTGDYLKCELKPINPGDYAQGLTAAQAAHLEVIFSEGICDYTKPPAGIAPVAGTWLAYPSPGVHSEIIIRN